MNYTYKCESCNSIGELEQFVPSAECPACGGEMRPMDEQGNISHPANISSSTNSGPVKVAKTVTLGFSGMLKNSGTGTGTGAFMPSKSMDSVAGRSSRTLPGSTGTDLRMAQQEFDPNKTNYPAPSTSQQQQQQQQNKSPKKTFSISKTTVKRPPDVQQKPANVPPPTAAPKPQPAAPAPAQSQMSIKKTQPNGATSIKFKIRGSGTSTQVKQATPPPPAPPPQQQQQRNAPPPQQQQRTSSPQAIPPQQQASSLKTAYQRTELDIAPPPVQNIEYQRQVLDSFNANESSNFREIQKQTDDAPDTAYTPSIPQQQQQSPAQPAPTHSEEAIEERIRIQSEKIAEERIRQAHLEMEKRFRDQQEIDARKVAEEAERRLRNENERIAKLAEEEKLRLLKMAELEKIRIEKLAEEEKLRLTKLAEEEKERSRKLAEEAAKKAAMQTFEMLTIKMEKEKEEARRTAEEKSKNEREAFEKRIRELEERNSWEKETLNNAVNKALSATSTNQPAIKLGTPDALSTEIPKIEEKPKDADLKEKDGISKEKMTELVKKDQSEDKKPAKDETTPVKTEPGKNETDSKDAKVEDKKPESAQKPEEKKEETKDSKEDSSKDEKKKDDEKDKDKNMVKKGLPPSFPKKKPGTNMGTVAGMKKTLPEKNSTTVTGMKKTDPGKDESKKEEKTGAETNGGKNGSPSKTQTGMPPVHGITHTGLLKLQDKKTKKILFMIISSCSLFAILLFILVLTLKSCAAKKLSSAPKPTPGANTSPAAAVSTPWAAAPKETPSTSTPEIPAKESPLKGNYLALRGKINKNPASKEEINNNIKILQGFLDTYSVSNPDDEWVKKAKEQIKAQEELKVWYQ